MMPVKGYKQSSSGSVVDPMDLSRALAAISDKRPTTLINIKSELNIKPGGVTKMEILVARLKDPPRPAPVDMSDLIFSFCDCGRPEKLNIHIGLRASNLSTTIDDYSTPMYDTNDYCKYIIESLITKRPELRHLEIMIELRRDEDVRKFKPFVEAIPAPINIPIFLNHIQVEVPGISSTQLSHWKYFLEQQQNLQTLICNFGAILWNFYALTITQNSRTLQKVVLRRIRTFDPVHPNQINPFNWGLFTNCGQLKHLKITCVKDDEKSRYLYRKTYPGISTGNTRPEDKFTHHNFRFMNLQSLEELHALRVKIDLKDLQWLKETGTHLRLICLECPDKEFYDGDIVSYKNTCAKDKDWGYKGFVSYENYNFEIINDDTRIITPICVVIAVVCLLILIAIVLAVVYFYGYNSGHHRRSNHLNVNHHVTSSGINKTTNSSIM